MTEYMPLYNLDPQIGDLLEHERGYLYYVTETEPHVKGELLNGWWQDKGQTRQLTDTEFFKRLLRAPAPHPAHIITHNGREYDLTALEMPFGLLMEKAPPVAEALKAWPYGWELYCPGGWIASNPLWARSVTYRAKPAPAEVRVQCYRGEYGTQVERGTCIKRANGTIDWSTWKASE